MRLLLVEDEKDIADFLETHLKSECFVVDVARDGEQGSYLGRTNDYCLIILDVQLPKKNGLEVLKDIRQRGKMMPVIVLSATNDPQVKIEFLNAGADDYLVKPVLFSELLARIRALRRRPAMVQEDILVVDNVTLDLTRHIVKRGEREIRLTQKEFMLLAYLMRLAGTAVSRSMILEHVWDANVDPFSNTIEAHILTLRKKIDTEGEKKLPPRRMRGTVSQRHNRIKYSRSCFGQITSEKKIRTEPGWGSISLSLLLNSRVEKSGLSPKKTGERRFFVTLPLRGVEKTFGTKILV